MTNESAEEYIRRETNKAIKQMEMMKKRIQAGKDKLNELCVKTPMSIYQGKYLYRKRPTIAIYLALIALFLIFFLIWILTNRNLYKINKYIFERRITICFVIILILAVSAIFGIFIFESMMCVKGGQQIHEGERQLHEGESKMKNAQNLKKTSSSQSF